MAKRKRRLIPRNVELDATLVKAAMDGWDRFKIVYPLAGMTLDQANRRLKWFKQQPEGYQLAVMKKITERERDGTA